MRKMKGGKRGEMGLGKQKEKIIKEENGRVKFKEVEGVDEEKKEIEEIVELMRDKKKLKRIGGKIKRGVMIVGNKGKGKKMIESQVEGEENVNLLKI